MNVTGTYEQSGGQPVVRFERTFPHPVAAVWEAVTDPEALGQWFPTTVEFAELRPGAPIAFRFAEDRYPPMSGEVLEVRSEQRLVFTWGDDRLTFELEPREDGAACRLAFSVVLDSAAKAARDSAGWEDCLDSLDQVVGGGVPQRPSSGERWRARYEEYKRLGLPATAEIPE
ncbi:MAG: SRPBCC family protein [Solirubrobacteraceae bacterium]